MHEQPQIYILRNPGAAAAGEQPELQLWTDPSAAVEINHPVLFFHGVEYNSIHEVLSDLVLPFERSAGTTTNEKRDFIILSWDSRLLRGEERKNLENSTINRLGAFLSRMERWPAYLRDAETRARAAAAYFEPYFRALSAREAMQSRSSALVVSHSFGSYLWATVLKMFVEAEQEMPPWTWWNFQPAMPRSSFCPGGEFYHILHQFRPQEDFPDLNVIDPRPRLVLWYSRVDFILATLYRRAKGSSALGQFGTPNPRVSQVDVTRLAGEAHGSNRIFGKARCFYARIAPFMQRELAVLRQESLSA